MSDLSKSYQTFWLLLLMSLGAVGAFLTTYTLHVLKVHGDILYSLELRQIQTEEYCQALCERLDAGLDGNGATKDMGVDMKRLHEHMKGFQTRLRHRPMKIPDQIRSSVKSWLVSMSVSASLLVCTFLAVWIFGRCHRH